MSEKDWTPERVEFVRRLRLLEGMSAGQIARKLHAIGFKGVSRSAVCGKLHRLGIEPPPKLAKQRGLQIKTHSNKMRGIARAAREKKPELPRYNPAEPILPGPYSVPFVERTKFQCAMFCEGEEGARGLVCGERVVRAQWCGRCAARIYAPTPPAKQGRAA